MPLLQALSLKVFSSVYLKAGGVLYLKAFGGYTIGLPLQDRQSYANFVIDA